MFIVTGFALVYPGVIAGILGIGLVPVACVLQYLRAGKESGQIAPP